MKINFCNNCLFHLISFSLVLLTIISCEKNLHVNNNPYQISGDSIKTLLNQSKNSKTNLTERKLALQKAFNLTNLQVPDSTKSNLLSKIAIQAELLKSDDLFKKVNNEALLLAKKLRDTFKIGDAHWTYGVFYSRNEVIDSAYYHYHKAYLNFSAINNEYYTAKMLYNMGFVQGRIKDYTGSEISIFKAISIFKKLDKFKRLYNCYNYLGLIYMELEEFDKAVFYHKKALDYLKKIDNKRAYKEGTLSNLGLTYQKQKKYDKAIENFEAALKNKNLKKININFYARLIDNINYTKFLNGDTTKIEEKYNYAFKIRDSLKNISGIVVSKRHLSEFYAYKLDTIKAINLAIEAYNLADQVENNRDKLATLLLLSKVNGKKSKKYLKEYVHLNDSLQIADRKTRNKFTRIRFETDEYIEETAKLSHQNLLIMFGSFFAILILSFGYFVVVQRTKNKELIFDREQQKSNQEIFSLMLKQQSKLEEGRLKERQRISQDLHDGVLGKIFGTRLGLGFLNIEGDETTIEKHKYYINELQNIEKEIRTISHELINEILSSKEDFSKIIEGLIKKKSKTGNFNYKFKISKDIVWDEISDEIKINLYRIIQEALQNILKYAKAENVKIKIKLKGKTLNLFIKDNGVGFDIFEKSKGIGLKNMKSRTTTLKGEFRVNSTINNGTTVYVSCPIKPQKNAKKL